MKPLKKIKKLYHNLNIKIAHTRGLSLIRKEVKELLRVNLFKTLYFNFTIFPFRDAIYLPVWLYGRIKLGTLEGRIIIEGKKRHRVICIGKTTDYFGYRYISSINIHKGGRWLLKGPFFSSQGTNIEIFGTLITGANCALGTGVNLRCLQEIHIGEGSDITLDCQVFDTNFHFLQDIKTGKISRMTEKIRIGDFCWIGNRTTISKGTNLPDYTIVCSNSLINKDYTELSGKHALIGGIPAKFIAEGLHRIYSDKIEQKISKQFQENQQSFIIEDIIPYNKLSDSEERAKHVSDF